MSNYEENIWPIYLILIIFAFLIISALITATFMLSKANKLQECGQIIQKQINALGDQALFDEYQHQFETCMKDYDAMNIMGWKPMEDK